MESLTTIYHSLRSALLHHPCSTPISLISSPLECNIQSHWPPCCLFQHSEPSFHTCHPYNRGDSSPRYLHDSFPPFLLVREHFPKHPIPYRVMELPGPFGLVLSTSSKARGTIAMLGSVAMLGSGKLRLSEAPFMGKPLWPWTRKDAVRLLRSFLGHSSHPTLLILAGLTSLNKTNYSQVKGFSDYPSLRESTWLDSLMDLVKNAGLSNVRPSSLVEVIKGHSEEYWPWLCLRETWTASNFRV